MEDFHEVRTARMPKRTAGPNKSRSMYGPIPPTYTQATSRNWHLASLALGMLPFLVIGIFVAIIASPLLIIIGIPAGIFYAFYSSVLRPLYVQTLTRFGQFIIKLRGRAERLVAVSKAMSPEQLGASKQPPLRVVRRSIKMPPSLMRRSSLCSITESVAEEEAEDISPLTSPRRSVYSCMSNQGREGETLCDSETASLSDSYSADCSSDELLSGSTSSPMMAPTGPNNMRMEQFINSTDKVDTLLGSIRPRSNDIIVHLGCGNGLLLNRAAKYYRSTAIGVSTGASGLSGAPGTSLAFGNAEIRFTDDYASVDFKILSRASIVIISVPMNDVWPIAEELAKEDLSNLRTIVSIRGPLPEIETKNSGFIIKNTSNGVHVYDRVSDKTSLQAILSGPMPKGILA
eukprot:Clim_evm61s128 gene=Clim_evmTU61s128